jgi:hypothetical protein
MTAAGHLQDPVPPGAVDAHYGRSDLLTAILEGLRAMGKDPDAPAIEDLAPVDHFHTRGRDATLELARLTGVAPGHRVLDVGGGLGGAARLLASEFDARAPPVRHHSWACTKSSAPRRARCS